MAIALTEDTDSARTLDFLQLAGKLHILASKMNVAWDRVITSTREQKVQAFVSAFVDTNVLIRRRIGDPPKMAARATAYLRKESDLLAADLIVAETIDVLGSCYEVRRAEIGKAMRALLVMESISVVDTPPYFGPLRSAKTTVLI